MHDNVTWEGCQKDESTTEHTLLCKELLGSNELDPYISNIEDLYGVDEYEQANIARLLKDNI